MLKKIISYITLKVELLKCQAVLEEHNSQYAFSKKVVYHVSPCLTSKLEDFGLSETNKRS